MNKIYSGKKIKQVVLDSEYYCSDVIEYLEAKEIPWSITADQDHSVKEAIESIPQEEWEPFVTEDGIVTDRQIAETVQAMNKGSCVFRLIVQRWRGSQLDLFKGNYHYLCIAADIFGGERL